MAGQLASLRTYIELVVANPAFDQSWKKKADDNKQKANPIRIH